jgi:hypothetical protein
MRQHDSSTRGISWLGRFLGFEVVLNDRRRPGRHGEGGARQALRLPAGTTLRLVCTFLARRRNGPRPWADTTRHLDRPA